MTPKKQLHDALSDALTSAIARGAFPTILELPLAQGAAAALTLSAADGLACLVDDCLLKTPRLAGAKTEKLREVGESLASRLTYLLEPIRLIETDADAGVAQLRSDSPYRDDEGAAYYELLVRRGGEIALRRYLRPPAQPRRAVPAHLTREVLVRLLGDFESAVE